MERKDFIRKSLLGTGMLAAGTAVARVMDNRIDELRPLEAQVGFNHLPPAQADVMDKMIIHRAETRGQADHGWLRARHSFSFAGYYNPERMHFGVLRVLNDDTIAGGRGFGTHPHDNMEIITIPLEGVVAHKDSMGNEGTISRGEVQVMSAGTGIHHSEFNHLPDRDLKLLQIWLFPNRHSVTPRYDQISLGDLKRNRWNQILSPSPDDAGVWIHQDAWFSLGYLDASSSLEYTLRRPVQNGVYAFVISGRVMINGAELRERDAIGLWDTAKFDVKVSSDAEILLMEVPMTLT
jgi:quercetin 2,3-dioxygenase